MEDISTPPTAQDKDIVAANDDEVRWILAAQTSPTSFEPLYLRYRGRVYHYLRTRLNNDEDAADATQQVFLQALKALPKYKQHGIPFAVWLFRIAHHLAINLSSRSASTVSWQALPEHPASEQDVEANVLQQETLAHLKRLLATLDPYKRELLSLRFAAGLTVPQIAAVLGKNPEAVKKQLSRMLQSFKEQYHDER